MEIDCLHTLGLAFLTVMNREVINHPCLLKKKKKATY